MNYLWEVAIRAKQQGIQAKNIAFKGAQSFSPYTELSFIDLNTSKVLPEIEINPYYRFFSIYKDYFNPDFYENQDLRLKLFDLIVQHINTVDVLQGMNKRDYYIKFILRDIKRGVFGKNAQEKINLFNIIEQNILANNILSLYDTAEEVYLLKDSIRQIFSHSIILANAQEKDELVFFMREKETPENLGKVELIQEFFMPLRFAMEIYWEDIFGIIDVDEIMIPDHIINY